MARVLNKGFVVLTRVGIKFSLRSSEGISGRERPHDEGDGELGHQGPWAGEKHPQLTQVP